MRFRSRPIRTIMRRPAIPAALVLLPGLTACTTGPALEPPLALHHPAAAEQVWVVLPWNNESGTAQVDTLGMADALAGEVDQVHGLYAVPVNRTLRVMRDLGLDGVRTPEEARLVMEALNADGLIAGTVTSYDPYPPVTLGVVAELHTQHSRADAILLDPVRLSRSDSRARMMTSDHPRPSLAVAGGTFHAAHHDVRAALLEYGRGRSEPDSAYGPEIYAVEMDRYVRFVSHLILTELLRKEHDRLHEQPMNDAPGTRDQPRGTADTSTRPLDPSPDRAERPLLGYEPYRSESTP